MNFTKNIIIALSMLCLFSCSQQDNAVLLKVSLIDIMPTTIEDGYTLVSQSMQFEEINTDSIFKYQYPFANEIKLPVGVYNIYGEMEIENASKHYHFKSTAFQYTLTTDASINIPWVMYNPNNTLVFGEIFFTGSLNAKGTGGLYDSYFTIYNNTDEVQYADGIAIVESKMHNASTDMILTEANQRNVNFTAHAIYVIPGNGADVPIKPGESIKIVDQAIDWSEHVSAALNHTDADFEWYDESTSASVVDTDNPDVPNLDKWYCYTLTIWIPSNQCNRSYALVKFPQGMTMERFLAEQKGDYDYVNAATGTQMHAQNCYLIKPEWIIDGINLCPTEKFTEPVLPASIDCGYAAISSKNSDVNRFGKKFVRKKSGVSANGNAILLDTDNSTNDFEIVSAH